MASNKKGISFGFEGMNRSDSSSTNGEIIARNEEEARKLLMRKGIQVKNIYKIKKTRTKKITQGDVTVFTRQLSTMMKAGLPLIQAFDIVAKGHSNPGMTNLLLNVKNDVEQGLSLSAAFSKYPKYFDKLYCNLIDAGEQGGVLDDILDKLATYKEKTESIKKKVKKALMYPAVVFIAAMGLITVMMVKVLPVFGEMYEGMGAELPALTSFMMDVSDFFVSYWWALFGGLALFIFIMKMWHKKSPAFQKRVDAYLLRVPVFGNIVKNAAIARWGRTCATLFHAGVPLVDALASVAGAAGNIIFEEATLKIRAQVNQGNSLISGIREAGIFPNMFVQMASIGEESGSLDDMLNKASEYYEEEVDNSVDTLSTLMEPFIMVFLGGIIGVILVAMYLPLFGMGDVVG